MLSPNISSTCSSSFYFFYLTEMSYSRETLDILMVLRVLRLVKIMGSIERFKVVIKTILSIGPSILTYALVGFVFFYIYAIVGMEFFADRIQEGNRTEDSLAEFCFNEKLKGSDFAKDNYCKGKRAECINIPEMT